MAKPSQRPTLKTISQLTGLAVPTVSRALSGAEDIGQATRERVRKVAKDIGYVPNRAGVRLRTGRSYVISLVLSTESDVMNLTAKLISSAAGALRDTRYHLTITPFFPDENPMETIENIVETQAADAVIMNQIQPEDPRVKYLMERDFPFVTHGRSAWSDQHDYYDFDNRAFAYQSVERLAERGRKSLLMLAPPRSQFYAQEMIRGAQEAADRLGLSFDVIDDVTSDSASDDIETSVGAALANRNGADGLICASSACCMSAVVAVERAGKQVSKDIDLCSKEASPFLTRFRPGILTQFEDAGAAGAFLAKAAVQRIEKPDSPLMQSLERPSRD